MSYQGGSRAPRGSPVVRTLVSNLLCPPSHSFILSSVLTAIAEVGAERETRLCFVH